MNAKIANSLQETSSQPVKCNAQRQNYPKWREN